MNVPSAQAGQIILVTGPARSGKSEWAEQLAEGARQSGTRTVIYVATARPMPEDAEWTARLAAHRRRRPGHWQLEEVPEDLTALLDRASADQCLLIDSLGSWLANAIEWEEDLWRSQVQTFRSALDRCPALVILVAEETGWGVVPAYALGRRFRDRLGQLTRDLGQQADAVYLAVAGYVLPLHGLGDRLDAE
ncbi:MAG: bifunctional adenosylcobinamide kinase/adenosylcobinamide-phosphate guanylyltransferase [Synechococcales cyanobacterium CRU_2_2]|nr:bifunctional adenosylcobinamide kinase/adenosylcobinamide-phosphate guanylyltransferase [Synechococcales cyanobacterium CRU_2_2]